MIFHNAMSFRDVSVPSASLTAPTNLSDDTNNPAWNTSLANIGGNMEDNVVDVLNKMKVFVRIFDTATGNYLKPGTYIFEEPES